MTPAQTATRKRLYKEFPFYSKHCLKIRTKAGEIKPLVLNSAQQILQDAVDAELADRGYVRIIILKGRQQGLSTHVGGFLYFNVSQKKARKSLVVTHHSDSTRALFDMTKRFHDNCPDIVKPSTKYASRRELSFNLLDSSYIVATAGGESIGRGETISDLHVSELAFWSPSTALENWNGLEQAVPKAPGTNIFVESTANGVSGVFYDLWKGAVDGTNGFRPVFIPWFLDTGYATPPDAPLEHTPEELKLIELYKLTDEQLQWRRHKIASSSLDLFRQEYPCNPEEAFLTSGRPIFHVEKLVERLQVIKDKSPIELRGLMNKKMEIVPRGEMSVFYPHDPKETYYIGADVSMGVGTGTKKDFSVAQVLDSKRRQVAVWRGHILPDAFAEVLHAMGTYYNTCLIAPESNNHGLLTCSTLIKDLSYPNVFMKTAVDTLTEKEFQMIGFRTDVKTKPLIIDELRANVRDNEIELNDKITINEMLTYVVTVSGSMEAEKGCFDDCVTSLAIANHINEGTFTPVEATDEWYLEAL
jgi:hypothetical protein